MENTKVSLVVGNPGHIRPVPSSSNRKERTNQQRLASHDVFLFDPINHQAGSRILASLCLLSARWEHALGQLPLLRQVCFSG